MNRFETMLTPEELSVFSTLNSPVKIQAFLDSLPYSDEDRNRCPRQVLQDRKAHCYDGALFAAAALRLIGYPPLVLDILPNPGEDDDHLLAIYKVEGHWGAIAKSNFVGLRYREPIFRNLRELVVSYFEDFYSIYRDKTMRAYTAPLNLKVYDRYDWVVRDDCLDAIFERVLKLRRYPILTPRMEAGLARVDQRFYQAGMMGANWDGIYKPVRPAGEETDTGSA